MHVFSGWYTNNASNYNYDWVGHALSYHIKWCQRTQFDYQFVASPMNVWSQLCHASTAWAFATFIKYEAMRIFMNNQSFGDIFYWIDLDVRPRYDASPLDLLNIGKTTFLAPKRDKHNLVGFDGYQCAKIFWSGLHHKPWYYALNTGIFTMSREHVNDFWRWLNKDHLINSRLWWDEYQNKKLKIKDEVDRFLCDRDGQGEVILDYVGTEEMLIEDWLHQTNIKFDQYPLSFLTSPDYERDGKYVHYYGHHKQNYPK